MKAILVFISFVSTMTCISQTLHISKQSALGSNGSDNLTAFNSPNGDGYYFIGTADNVATISFDKSENGRGQYDLWMVKTDLNFNKIWDRTLGGTIHENFASAVVLNDRIIISCISSSGISGDKTVDTYGNNDVWMICMDLNGNILWQKAYGGSKHEASCRMISYSDSSCLLAISSSSPISGNKLCDTYSQFPFFDKDIWLVEIGVIDGHIIKQNNIGSTADENVGTLMKSPNSGRLFMTARSRSGVADYDKTDPGFGSNFFDIWLTEIDADLNVIRDKCFGGIKNESFAHILFDENDNLILGINTESGISGNKSLARISEYGQDCWLIKIDNNFNTLWERSYGGNYDQGISNLFYFSENAIVMSCSSASEENTGNKTSVNYGYVDSWIVVLDNNGNDYLQFTLGGSENDYSGLIKHFSDSNKLIFTSFSRSSVSGNRTVSRKGNTDTWIGELIFDPLEGVFVSEVVSYPNPFFGEIILQFEDFKENVVLKFHSTDGKILDVIEIDESTSYYKWKTNFRGLIHYSIKGERTDISGKILSE